MHTVFIISTLLLSFTKTSDNNNEATMEEERLFNFDNIRTNADHRRWIYVINHHCLPPAYHNLTSLRQQYDEKNHEELAQNVGILQKYYAYIADEIWSKPDAIDYLMLFSLSAPLVFFLGDLKELPTLNYIFPSANNFKRCSEDFEKFLNRKANSRIFCYMISDFLRDLEDLLRQKLKPINVPTEPELAASQTQQENSVVDIVGASVGQSSVVDTFSTSQQPLSADEVKTMQ